MRRLVGAQAYAVPAATLERFLDGWSGGPPVCLAVDTREGGLRLEELADRVQVLLFRASRGGFGRARRSLLLAAEVLDPDEVLVCDADGQYDPGDLDSLPPLGDLDAAISQRDRVDLPLRGGGLNRLAAEALQAWCVAHGAGRPDLARLDMQPGAFLLGPRARRLLAGEVTTPAFDWDLAATRCLLTSGLRLGFPPVSTRPQQHTSFTLEDARGNLGVLGRWFGAERVEEWTDRFMEEEAGRYAAEDLARLRDLTRSALQGG